MKRPEGSPVFGDPDWIAYLKWAKYQEDIQEHPEKVKKGMMDVNGFKFIWYDIEDDKLVLSWEDTLIWACLHYDGYKIWEYGEVGETEINTDLYDIIVRDYERGSKEKPFMKISKEDIVKAPGPIVKKLGLDDKVKWSYNAEQNDK